MSERKYKEPIELMAEEIAESVKPIVDPVSRRFILGQGEYLTGYQIIEATAEEVRELRRIVSNEQARSVALTARVKELEEALERISTPAAFYVATAHVDPEAFARMIFAEKVSRGMSVEDAEKQAEVETWDRYPIAALAKGDADG